jgi:hypothetical protein
MQKHNFFFHSPAVNSSYQLAVFIANDWISSYLTYGLGTDGVSLLKLHSSLGFRCVISVVT